MTPYVLRLDEVDRTAIDRVGGKAARLGEILRLEGARVPDGICVTTSAWQQAAAPALDGRLSRLRAADGATAALLSAEIRAALAGVEIPTDVASAIIEALASLGGDGPYAVRSSATAEDAPTTSFAGQHDTQLDVVGADAVLRSVRRCWASLHTDRAVAYRAERGLDHRAARMAVVVQRMLSPDASGVLFTADPVTGDRTISSIEAVRGRGEALVSGHASPDVHKVRRGQIVAATVHDGPALSDDAVLRLADLGRHIEAHFGEPQDIEWCLVDGAVYVVQARPITTLFPIPEGAEPGYRVFMSVGHSQMMTDAMKPLGLSLWRMTTRRPMFVAASRLFVDVTAELASPATRLGFLSMVSRSDPLTGSALQAVVDRGDLPLPPDADPPRAPSAAGPPPVGADPTVVAALVRDTLASLDRLEGEIRSRSGVALLDFILEDLRELQRLLGQSHAAACAGIEATWWLNDKLYAWLGERSAADALTLAAPDNVTSQMGLDLLRLADVIRPHPEVVGALGRARDGTFLDDLPRLPGGAEARDAILAFLAAYGARCPGEIDITRPRWGERPDAILPALLNHVRSAEAGAAERIIDRGLRQAAAARAEILDRLRALPDGEAKATEAERRIDRLRAFIGFREFPKYGMIRRYFVYKRALLAEAERLVQAGILRDAEDISFLTLPELRQAAAGDRPDPRLIDRRRVEYAVDARRAPPRVMTSDGEIVSGAYARERIPEGALVGLPVSRGVAEGRARVVLDLADAALEPGDILITRFTDPSWTPVFFGIAGLVAEVGGQMTHGSVIAREYGLPAVVAVEGATRLILDGQRVRVHGAEGYVELLPSAGRRAT